MQEPLKKRSHSDDVTIDLRKLCFSLQNNLLDAIRLASGRRPVQWCGCGLHDLEGDQSSHLWIVTRSFGDLQDRMTKYLRTEVDAEDT